MSFSQRIEKVFRDPRLLRDSLKRRIAAVPFALGITSVWPGTILGYVPDRYGRSKRQYQSLNGTFLSSKTKAKFFKGNAANNRGDLSRFYFLNLVCEQLAKERISGDVAELGVYKGNTASVFAAFAERQGRTIYLLDTFTGFDKRDLGGVDQNVAAAFGDTSVPGVQELIGTERSKFVVGYFPETEAQLPEAAQYCLVHIDCDLYAPFRAALEYFYPRLSPGGFLIMHDYCSLVWDGATRAVDEFLCDKPERLTPIPDKSGTAVIRKNYPPLTA